MGIAKGAAIGQWPYIAGLPIAAPEQEIKYEAT